MGACFCKKSKNRKFPLAFAAVSVYNDRVLSVVRLYPPVAKLDIAVDSDSKGRGFESLRAGQVKESPLLWWLFYFVRAVGKQNSLQVFDGRNQRRDCDKNEKT